MNEQKPSSISNQELAIINSNFTSIRARHLIRSVHYSFSSSYPSMLDDLYDLFRLCDDLNLGLGGPAVQETKRKVRDAIGLLVDFVDQKRREEPVNDD